MTTSLYYHCTYSFMFVTVDQFTVNFDHLDMLSMKVDGEVLTAQETIMPYAINFRACLATFKFSVTGLPDLAIQQIQIWDPRDARREKAAQVLRLKQLTQSKYLSSSDSRLHRIWHLTP